MTMNFLDSLVHRPFKAFCFVVAFLGGLQAFQWTVTSPEDNLTTYLSPGEDLPLPWNFTLADGEIVSTVQWFFRGSVGESLIAMATPRGGFVPTAAYAGRVDYRPWAGMVLRGWSSGGATVAENGSYAVEVAILAAGSSYATYRRTTNVQFTEQSTEMPNLSRFLHLEERVRGLEAQEVNWTSQLYALLSNDAVMASNIARLQASVSGLTTNLSQHITAKVETPDFATSSAPCAAGTHGIFNQSWRHEHYDRDSSHCDNYLVPGWYRFIFNGVEAIITNRCPSSFRCGTQNGMWLDIQGEAMPVVGQEVTARAYGASDSDCYYRQNRTVTVRNCGPYYVYKLLPSLVCDTAYCITTVL